MSLVAELQQKVEYQEMLILDARKQNDLLKNENDLLKALVLDMYRTIRGPYADRRPLETYRYKGRMRALGIEVN